MDLDSEEIVTRLNERPAGCWSAGRELMRPARSETQVSNNCSPGWAMTAVYVHDLAAESGMTSSAVLHWLRTEGAVATSASSPVDLRLVARFRATHSAPAAPLAPDPEIHGKTLAEAAQLLGVPVVELKPRQGHPHSARPGEKTRHPGPRQQSARNRAAQVDEARRALGGGAILPCNPYLPAHPVRQVDPVRQARGSRGQKADEWASRFFTPAQKQVWVRAGLGEADAMIAEQCVEAGILPDQLSQRLAGFSAVRRLRGGESVASVRIRLDEASRRT